MKLKTEQEINNLAVDTYPFSISMADAYYKGYIQAEQDLISQASEGFEEWFNNEIERLSNQRTKQGDITPDAVITITMLESNKGNLEKLWQASKLSSAKELKELKKENEELKKENEERKSIEIRKRHGLDKSEDMPSKEEV